ncbi:MAG: class I SAM-dependent methyltransferase [Candidatus Gracilibacteria bacterium]
MATNSSKLNAKFYNNFASIHDIMLPIEERLFGKSFFEYIFKKNSKKNEILDCACGTGIHVILLSKLGCKVDGMDLSSGMIKQAKINLKKFNIKADLKVGDFRKIKSVYGEKKYDVVACLGNSLAYMQTEKDLKKALGEMFNALKPNGMLIISQRNYDKLLKDKKKYNAIQQDKFTFLYIYNYLKRKVVFNIIAGVTNNNHTTFKTFKTTYNPILQKDLKKHMQEMGCRNIKFYNQGNEKEYFKFNKEGDEFFAITGVK